MKSKVLLLYSIFIVFAVLAACNSGSDDPTSSDDPTVGDVLSGTASKGPIAGGSITVYALDAEGKRGDVLGTTMTAADGSYSLDLGNYTGPILVELTGGNYIDEASGLTIDMSVLRAATHFSGNTVVSITPLTELAVRKAGTLTETNIATANELLSTMIGGIDIIGTLPANTLLPPAEDTTAEELDYGLALAAISQMVNGQLPYDTIDATLTDISTDLVDNQLATTGDKWSTALAQFLASVNNQTGLTIDTTTLDQALEDSTIRPIGTDSSPVSITIAFSNQLSSSQDGTYYTQTVAVIVTDANFNPVANREIFLKLWPVSYNHGYWARNVGGTCQIYYTNWPSGACNNSYQQLNEDINMNLIMDTGEDVGPMGLPDGFLTPPVSAAGSVPAFVITDETGLARFEIHYLKIYAAWINDNLSVSTSALMTENLATYVWTLNVTADDAAQCDGGGVYNSPFGFVADCPGF